jgi:hypothetical protein
LQWFMPVIPATQETKAGGLWAQGQPGLHSETLFQTDRLSSWCPSNSSNPNGIIVHHLNIDLYCSCCSEWHYSLLTFFIMVLGIEPRASALLLSCALRPAVFNFVFKTGSHYFFWDSSSLLNLSIPPATKTWMS